MASPLNVMEDARESEPARAEGSRLGWLLAGAVIGAGLTVLAVGVNTTEPPTETTIEGLTTQALGEGVGDQIAGFPDGLVAVRRSNGQTLDLLTWPVAGESYVRNIPIGSASPPQLVAFDSAGRRLATIVPLESSKDPGVLYAGIPDLARVISTSVTGFAWHDTDPGTLAYSNYSTLSDGELAIWTVSGTLADPVLLTRAVGVGGGVAAWGDWGFVIDDQSATIVTILNSLGEIVSAYSGHLLGVGPGGVIAIDDGSFRLIDAAGGPARQVVDDGSFSVARFSPDGRWVALLTQTGLSVLSASDGSMLAEFEARPGFPQITWTSNGRFVVFPGTRGLFVAEPNTEKLAEVMSTDVFISTGVLPLSEDG
ncbi:MAG: hypothetical protein WBZ40_11225 [Acidimicrobiia bacterium]